MKTVGDKLGKFLVTGIKPGALSGDDAFMDITEESFKGQWKISRKVLKVIKQDGKQKL